jgi:hypothetical protein
LKRLLSRSAWVLGGGFVLLLGLLLVLGGFRWHPARGPQPPRVESAAHGVGPLLAGAAELPLPVSRDTPLGGFPRLAWTNEGVRDAVGVRALVLSEPGCTVALVSAEILLVPGKLARTVEQRVRDLGIDAVVLGATHTHAGPGGYFDDALGERIATGPYTRARFEELAERIVEAVRAAAAASAPAVLSTARADLHGLARNRDGGPVDGRLLAVRVSRPSGERVSEVLVFPAHPTLLGGENRRISGDWPGYLMRAVGPVTLFFQGAVGDQSAAVAGHPAQPIESFGRALAARVAALRFATPSPAPELDAAVASVVLPVPEPGAPPPFFRRLASNVLYRIAPARGRVVAVRLGPALLLAVPAEPVAEVGRRWREAAGDGAEVVSLAGDYLGYVETSEVMSERLGETQRTYYGPELADRLGAAARAAAQAADGGRESP